MQRYPRAGIARRPVSSIMTSPCPATRLSALSLATLALSFSLAQTAAAQGVATDAQLAPVLLTGVALRSRIRLPPLARGSYLPAAQGSTLLALRPPPLPGNNIGILALSNRIFAPFR